MCVTTETPPQQIKWGDTFTGKITFHRPTQEDQNALLDNLFLISSHTELSMKMSKGCFVANSSLSLMIYLPLVTTWWCVEMWSLISLRPLSQLIYFLLGGAILLCGNILIGWVVLISKFRPSLLSSTYSSWFCAIFVVCGTISSGLFLLAMSNPSCVSVDFPFPKIVWNCERSGISMPCDQLLAVFVAPLITKEIIGCQHNEAVMIAWMCSVIFIIAAASHSLDGRSMIVAIYSVLFGLFIFNLEKKESTFSSTLVKLDELKVHCDAQAMITMGIKGQASTFKRIIASLSHDLLTPIQALTFGIDAMNDILREGCEEFDVIDDLKTRDAGRCVVESASDSVSQDKDSMLLNLLQGLKGTTIFMSMIIYRCMDAFECSDGSALKPNIDKFDFRYFYVIGQHRHNIDFTVLKDTYNYQALRFESMSLRGGYAIKVANPYFHAQAHSPSPSAPHLRQKVV